MPTYVEHPSSQRTPNNVADYADRSRDSASQRRTKVYYQSQKSSISERVVYVLLGLAVLTFMFWQLPRELHIDDAVAGLLALLLGKWRELIFALLLTWLLVYPVLSYLTYSWARKREEILSSLTDQDKNRYLILFYKDDSTTIQNASIRFERIYDHWYGRRRYALPILVLFVAAFADDVVLAQGILPLLSTADGDTMSIITAASAGGYAYVVYDLILRQQRRDLSASDVLRGALRLVIAIPLGVSVSSIAKDWAMFIAFAVGVFPLDTLALILRRLVNKKLGLEVGVDSGSDQVASLTGIDQPTADRIQQADITTITQLAWCDPVQLSMRSNLSFSYVLDIVSQALAWVYLGSKLPLLAPMGLRGAVEIRHLLLDCRSDVKDDASAAEAVIAEESIATNQNRPSLLNAFEQIAYDPATEFLFETL